MSKTNDKTNEQPAQAKARRKPLAAIHRETAYAIQHYTADACSSYTRRLKIWLTKLAAAAPLAQTEQAPHELYLACVHALIARDGHADHRPVKEVQEIAKWMRAARAEKAQQATAASKQEQIRVNVTASSTSLRPFGIEPGDQLWVSETPCAELRPGDLIALWDKEDQEWDFGRFIDTGSQLWEQTDDTETPYIGIMTGQGKSLDYMQTAYTCYLVIAITRTITVPRGTTADTDEARRAGALAALHARLDKLDADEITDTSARFKLEKQIYDLEREAAAEWDEYITDGGAR
jgi:hypothetical protein